MIVYGEPSHETSTGVLLGRLRQRAEQAGSGGADGRRRLLIEAGQLEQAVADLRDDGADLRAVMTLTDLAAEAFLNHSHTGVVRAALARTEPPTGERARVKIPEGFAFYTLFPEQYAHAARQWALDHAGAATRRAVVVGLRSIGTSLSAVVARVLAGAGWEVRRLTVRPTGHPYDRRVELPAGFLGDAGFALVVDEGPGRSGSSMAGAGRALAEAGLDRSKISFFPGHASGPGGEGSAGVRRWWSDTRIYLAGLDAPAWNGRPLPDALAEIGGGSVIRVEDLSGGRWRESVYPDEQDWPAAFPAFERTKYRMARSDGPALLWRFEGLTGGAEASLARLHRLAAKGWTLAPVRCAFGFVARPWVEGLPLRRPQCSAGLLARLGRYVAEAAGPPLTVAEQAAGQERLREMLYWNTRESLGEAMAERARRWDGWALERPLPGYGDGRLGPEEWLRIPDGRLVKVDCAGHDRDHTVVGRQPLFWDLAGAMVEWDLDGAAAKPLLEAFVDAAGEGVSPEGLAFCRGAYAAFRLGQCEMCAGTADPDEQARLRRATGFYRSQLARLLAR